jgi:hypothetical protein
VLGWRAGWNYRAGRTRPAGRRLPTPVLKQETLRCKFAIVHVKC